MSQIVFDPYDYYSLAQEVLQMDTQYTEARNRTAISRAYYAAFLLARQLVKDKRPDLLGGVERREIHFRVREALQGMGQHVLASKLFQLARWRGNSDYDIDRHIGRSLAEMALRLADDIIRGVMDVRKRT